MWERGLKHAPMLTYYNGTLSLPVWERGLKHLRKLRMLMQKLVAPRVGAWIETLVSRPLLSVGRSLPVWERGLKL